jgi:hypothetical protein
MAELPPDPPPSSDPEPTPRFPKGPQVDHAGRPETLARNAEVVPPPEDDDLELDHETTVRVEEALEESLNRFPAG